MTVLARARVFAIWALLLSIPALWPADLGLAAQSATAKLSRAAASVKDATFDIAFQQRVNGRMQPEQTAAVKSRGKALYMRWTGKVRKESEVLIRPGFNNGNAWIKEGGPLSFSAVSIPADHATIMEQYRHPADYYALDNLVADILARFAEASVETGKDGALIATGDDGSRYALRLDSRGLPASGELVDGSGAVQETWSISGLKTNVGLTDADFDPKNPAYGFPGYSEDGIFIDPKGLKANLEKSWNQVNDYSCVLVKQERMGADLQPEHTVELKFRKPLDLYLKWIGGPKKGRQLLFRKEVDEKMTVREPGVLGIATVHISPDSKLAKQDTHHHVAELSIGNTIRIIHENLVRALENGDAKINFKGTEVVGGRKVNLVESFFPDHKSKGYYAAHSIIGHDTITGLPVKVTNYDENERILEWFEWRRLRVNNGFTNADFDPENPNYSF